MTVMEQDENKLDYFCSDENTSRAITKSVNASRNSGTCPKAAPTARDGTKSPLGTAIPYVTVINA